MKRKNGKQKTKVVNGDIKWEIMKVYMCAWLCVEETAPLLRASFAVQKLACDESANTEVLDRGDMW